MRWMKWTIAGLVAASLAGGASPSLASTIAGQGVLDPGSMKATVSLGIHPFDPAAELLGSGGQGAVGELAALSDPSSSRMRFLLSASEADRVVAEGEEVTPDWETSGAAGAPRRWWPLVMSAVLPGLGEAVTGHMRGYFLMAADVASIGASVHYDQVGDDREDEYIAFADAHWSEDRWEEALRTEDQAEWFGTDYQSKDEVPLYVSREEDAREYYENLGKWDIFWYGWEDSKPRSITDPVDWDWAHPPAEFMTPLRDQYLDMRTASNDAYDKSNTFRSISLILRVFSVVQVAYLEGFVGGRYKSDYEGPGVGGSLAHLEESHGAQVNWFVDAGSIRQARLGLQVRY